MSGLLELTLIRALNVKQGYEFTVSDLYALAEWNELSVITRASLGKEFKDYVMTNPRLFVPAGKTPAGQQIYERI